MGSPPASAERITPRFQSGDTLKKQCARIKLESQSHMSNYTSGACRNEVQDVEIGEAVNAL